MLIFGAVIFEYGRYQGGFDSEAAAVETQGLNDQIVILNSRIDELTLENAQLASDSEIDATANEQVTGKLRQLNEEILELKEELVFYRSLLTPAELEPGLQILGVQMSNKGKSQYGYKVVLAQRRNRNRLASGNVSVEVVGLQDGRTTRLYAKDLINNSEKALAFRFKNFLSLEGQLTVPGDFTPQNILVGVNPRERGLKRVERSFKWDSIVTGG